MKLVTQFSACRQVRTIERRRPPKLLETESPEVWTRLARSRRPANSDQSMIQSFSSEEFETAIFSRTQSTRNRTSIENHSYSCLCTWTTQKCWVERKVWHQCGTNFDSLLASTIPLRCSIWCAWVARNVQQKMMNK